MDWAVYWDFMRPPGTLPTRRPLYFEFSLGFAEVVSNLRLIQFATEASRGKASRCNEKPKKCGFSLQTALGENRLQCFAYPMAS
jgi:hypothetical protein